MFFCYVLDGANPNLSKTAHFAVFLPLGALEFDGVAAPSTAQTE